MQGFGPVRDTRTFRLEHVHNSNEMEAEVAQPHPYGHPFTWEYVLDYDGGRRPRFLDSHAAGRKTSHRGDT